MPDLLAEFKEKRAFPLLLDFLRLSEDEIGFLPDDSLTEAFYRLLLSTFDSEKIQIMFDVIKNTKLYLYARVSAIMAYGLLIIMFAEYYDFIDCIFSKEKPEPSYINDAVS
ncbi:MAG: DUF1186 family protein [Clostridiales bacterium]|jgi:hypothetical protein|nr:DUF1186 family protein [Clostridiales bacterium]